VLYSMTDAEWPTAQSRLAERLHAPALAGGG